jgi:hypothetical protein
LDDLDKRLVRLVSVSARVSSEIAEFPSSDTFDDDFREGGAAREGGAVLLPQTAARADVIDRNVISDTIHVRLPRRDDEPRPGLVRPGRPSPPREPERRGFQERRTERFRLAAIAPAVEEE